MKKLNDSTRSPLRYVFDNGLVVGQFYNSWDKRYHLASYVPDKQPPRTYLCGEAGNFSPSRDENPHDQCKKCQDELVLLQKLDIAAT